MPQGSPRGMYLEVSESLREKFRTARSLRRCRPSRRL